MYNFGTRVGRDKNFTHTMYIFFCYVVYHTILAYESKTLMKCSQQTFIFDTSKVITKANFFSRLFKSH